MALAVNQAADLPAGLCLERSAVARLAVRDSQITAAASRKPMMPKAARAMRAGISIGIGVCLWIILERAYREHGD